jgi:hypothetical protein
MPTKTKTILRKIERNVRPSQDPLQESLQRMREDMKNQKTTAQLLPRSDFFGYEQQRKVRAGKKAASTRARNKNIAQMEADDDLRRKEEAVLGERETFSTDAVRCAGVAGDKGAFPLRYDLIFGNTEALKRIARTYGEGSLKYAPNNWKKGFPESVLFNHALAHLTEYAEGDTSEDHLAHAAWNILTLMHQQTHHLELMDMTNPEAPKEP